MADRNYTALVLVIDRSGSMSSMKVEMEASLTQLLRRQAADEGLTTVDVITFDDQVEHIYSLASPNKLKLRIVPRGMTALHDAIGKAVSIFERVINRLPEHAKPSKTQVIVITDGQENASQEFDSDSLKSLINQKTKDSGWDFIFLGANQDAVLTGRNIGFESQSSMTFASDGESLQHMTTSIDRYIKDFKRGKKKGFSDDERKESNGKEGK